MKTIFALNNSTDPKELASFCLEMGIDAPILNPKFFNDDCFIKVLRQNHLKIWLNIPIFYNEKYLAGNPGAYSITSQGNRAIHSWLHMVCPSHKGYREHLREEIRELVRRVNPDYISYDFIRFFVFWEEAQLDSAPEHIEHGCYCDQCRKEFRRFSGENIHIENGFINKSQRKVLGVWKTGLISETVRDLNALVNDYAKDIPIYIKTVPWQRTDLEQGLSWIAGQDIQSLGRLSDGVIPMAFTQILGQTPSWKRQLLDHVKELTGKEVMSYIQFEPLIRKTPISSDQVEEEIKAVLAQKRAGLIYFYYEKVAGNLEKQAVIKKYKSLGFQEGDASLRR